MGRAIILEAHAGKEVLLWPLFGKHHLPPTSWFLLLRETANVYEIAADPLAFKSSHYWISLNELHLGPTQDICL